jgi:hypothetical protein
MSHKCRHRIITDAAYVPHSDPTFSIPPDPGPIDDAMEYLLHTKTPEVEEIMLSTTKLIFESTRCRIFLDTIFELLEDTTCPTTAQNVPKIYHQLAYVMAMGFLSGTAIGFAAGLQFEAVDEDENDDDGPDYEGPMV